MNLSLLPYTPERDVYRLLQIHPDADGREVVLACRRLARTFHPDMNGSPRATQEMQVINAVRLLLTDPAQRAAYDGSRRRYLADRRLEQAAAVRQADAPRLDAPRLMSRAQVALETGVTHATRAVTTARSAVASLRETWVEALGTVAAFAARRRCPRCQSPVTRDYRFCADCGTRLLVAAPESG